MSDSPLISPRKLQDLQALQAPTANVVVFDCSYDLGEPGAGQRAYLQAHLPGALHADLSRDLSAPRGQGASGGRHPLPERAAFARWLAQTGLSNDTLAVVYDRNGLNFAGRLWWMLRWAGHANVLVLDGGLQAWQAAGGTIESGAGRTPEPGDFQLRPALQRLVDAEYVRAGLDSDRQILVDARAPERYRGEVEPLDAVAGHIPGALNRPFSANLDAQGRLKPAAQLRAEFDALLAGHPADAEVIHYCGSGVSATPNVLAMAIAGLPAPSLYAGSWSDWSSRCDYPKA